MEVGGLVIVLTNDTWKAEFLNRIYSEFPEISWASTEHRDEPIDIILTVTVESSIEVVDHLKITCCVDRKRINDDNVVFEKLFDGFCKTYLRYLSDHGVDTSNLSLEY